MTDVQLSSDEAVKERLAPELIRFATGLVGRDDADHGLAIEGLVLGPITRAAITADCQWRIPDLNGAGRLDRAEIGIIGDATNRETADVLDRFGAGSRLSKSS